MEFGRNLSSIVKTESAKDANEENTYAAVKTEYTYPEYEDNKTSNRIESFVNKVYYGTSTDGNNYNSYTGYAYDYDANGNITAEYSLNAGGTKSLRYGYVYDELNQLVRVNDAIAQKTYVYTYDGAGNILTKSTYPYTTGDLGVASNTVNYAYDGTWKDKLISYGNTGITYDNIGNPLTIGNNSFTWSGRQLETYVSGNNEITFQYDENGLRHRKTVKENGIITEQYDYVWSDGALKSQTYTTYSNGTVSSVNTAKFIYDDWGLLQGFILNDSSVYLYTKNLQGDITSVVNEKGQTILNYSYDAWGAVTFSATSMQNMMLAYTLSFVSPFTYRGYCYDYDIELYYLQSRYYSPEIGRFINTDDTQIAIATQGEILGTNLFAYCNNNPVNYEDPTGKIGVESFLRLVSLGMYAYNNYLCVRLYTWGFIHRAKNKCYDFSSSWNSLIVKLMQKSTLISSTVNQMISDAKKMKKSSYSVTKNLNFYSYKKNISDIDLILSLGGGAKMTISIKDENQKKSGKQLYKITCQLKDECFDFSYWNKNNAHSNITLIRLINNIGYYTQKFGAFIYFTFQFKVSYNYWYK